MQFSKWKSVFKRAGIPCGIEFQEFEKIIEQKKELDESDPGHARHSLALISEYVWLASLRPYYQIWPSIEELLLSSDLDFPCERIVFPCESIVFEFSESGQYAEIAVLICNNDDSCFVNFYDSNRDGNISFVLNLKKGLSLRQSFEISEVPASKPCFDALTMIFGAFILANDPELIEPIVLSRDSEKYETATPEQKKTMEDRAARIKGRGWAIGKGFEEQCEINPHFRKSHLALFWTGKGREKPVLKLRRGCLVKSRKVTEIPTGYYDEEELLV